MVVLVSIALVGLIVVSLGAAYELRASQRRFSEVQTNIRICNIGSSRYAHNQRNP